MDIINVISITPDEFVSCNSFKNTEDGIKESEDLFAGLVKECDENATEDDIETGLINGQYENDGFVISIIWTTI